MSQRVAFKVVTQLALLLLVILSVVRLVDPRALPLEHARVVFEPRAR